MRFKTAAIILWSAAMGATSGSAEETWAVLAEQANCLLENIESYTEATASPIVIFMKVCPVVDRMEALMALQQNSGSLPSVSVEAATDAGKALDEVIVYTAEELECLKSLSLDLSTSPVLLPQTPCDP